MQQFSQQDAGHEGVSKEPPNLEEPKEMERGYPAKSVPKHGPGFSVWERRIKPGSKVYITRWDIQILRALLGFFKTHMPAPNCFWCHGLPV